MTRVAIDETAAWHGHDFITLFVDIDRARVQFATEGRDAGTITAFADDLTAHGGDRASVAEVCINMSPAFIKGVGENLPNAAITFDKFHAAQIINDAVNRVRRDEQKNQPELKKTGYVWLKNESNLSGDQRQVRDSLASRNLPRRAATVQPATSRPSSIFSPESSTSGCPDSVVATRPK